MPYSIRRTEGRLLLELEGSVTIRHVDEFWQELRDACDDGDVVEVRTRNLSDIDTCVLQLLCSLGKSVGECGYAEPSQELLEAVERCGLNHSRALQRPSGGEKEKGR